MSTLIANVFLAESSQLLYQSSMKFSQTNPHILGKHYTLQLDVSKALKDAEKWHFISNFCAVLFDLNDAESQAFSKKWNDISELMIKKGDEPVEIYNGIIYAELSTKVNVVIFPNNSALHIRKIAGNAVFTTARINDIYDEQNATKILYQASEASAYDVIKKIRKIADVHRLSTIEIEEEVEGM